MLLSKCIVSDGKKSNFVKEQEPRGLLSKLNKNTDSNWFIHRKYFVLKV